MNDITLLRTDSLNTDPVTGDVLAATRELLMAEILAERTTSPRRRAARRPLRRMAAIAAVAAVAAAGIIAIPAVLPTHSPGAPASAAAATLQQLAAVAANTPATAFGPSQFLHQTQTTNIDDQGAEGGGCVGETVAPISVPAGCRTATVVPVTVVEESWTGYDGSVWLRQTAGARVTVTVEQLTGYTPRLLATLPTDTAVLHRYIEAHPAGDAGDMTTFATVFDILSRNLAPAAVRAAAFRVLQDSGQHITVGTATRDPLGRPGVELIIEPVKAGAGITSMMFDPTTSLVLSTQLSTPARGVYRTQTFDSTPDVVSAVPADVVSSAGR